MFIIEKDKNSLREIGFSKIDIILLNLEIRKFLKEGHEEYLDYIRNEEESIIERILNK